MNSCSQQLPSLHLIKQAMSGKHQMPLTLSTWLHKETKHTHTHVYSTAFLHTLTHRQTRTHVHKSTLGRFGLIVQTKWCTWYDLQRLELEAHWTQSNRLRQHAGLQAVLKKTKHDVQNPLGDSLSTAEVSDFSLGGPHHSGAQHSSSFNTPDSTRRLITESFVFWIRCVMSGNKQISRAVALQVRSLSLLIYSIWQIVAEEQSGSE